MKIISKKIFYAHQVLLSMNILWNMGSQAILLIVFSSDYCTAGATNTYVEHWACHLWSGGVNKKASFEPFGLEKDVLSPSSNHDSLFEAETLHGEMMTNSKELLAKYILRHILQASFLTNLSLFFYPDEIWFLPRPPPTFLINVIKYPSFFWDGLKISKCQKHDYDLLFFHSESCL